MDKAILLGIIEIIKLVLELIKKGMDKKKAIATVAEMTGKSVKTITRMVKNFI